MSNEKFAAPTALKLANGEEITVANSPELKEFFDLTARYAASQEKSKLYQSMQSLEAKNIKLEADNKTLNDQVNENLSKLQLVTTKYLGEKENWDKYQRDREAVAQANAETPFVTKSDFDRIMSEMFTTKLPEVIKQNLAPITAHAAQIEADRVAAHKAKAIAECNGQLAVEVVQGNTIEEIDASVELAKQIYQNVLATVTGNPAATGTGSATNVTQTNQPTTAASQQQPVTPATPVVLPSFPRVTNPALDTNQNVKGMSLDEFGANRDKIMAGLGIYESQYASNSPK